MLKQVSPAEAIRFALSLGLRSSTPSDPGPIPLDICEKLGGEGDTTPFRIAESGTGSIFIRQSLHVCLWFAKLGAASEGIELFRRKLVRKPLLAEPFEVLKVFDVMMVNGLAKEHSLPVNGRTICCVTLAEDGFVVLNYMLRPLSLGVNP